MTNKEELLGFRRDRYFSRAWDMLTQEKGWWKPIVLCALAYLVPIVGPLAVMGYGIEWSRRVSWGSTEAPVRKVKVGDLIASGWRRFVVVFGWMLAAFIVGQILPEVPLVGDFLGTVWGIVLIFIDVVILAAAVRATIYQSFKAGYRVKTLWTMVSRDPWGLARIWLIEFVVSVIEKVVALLVLLPSLLGTIPYFIRLFEYVDSYYYYIDDYGAMSIFFDVLGYLVGQIGGAVLAVIALALVVKSFSSLLTCCCMGLWMRQFDVPSWGREDDPLPDAALEGEKPEFPEPPAAPQQEGKESETADAPAEEGPAPADAPVEEGPDLAAPCDSCDDGESVPASDGEPCHDDSPTEGVREEATLDAEEGRAADPDGSEGLLG